MSQTKILSEQTILKSSKFQVDKVSLERNGKIFTKDIITRNDIVVILPITSNNEIYLIKQYRDAFQKELLEVIGGTIDTEASPLETAKRELKEEAGLTAKTWKQLQTVAISANIKGNVFVFLASDLTEGVQTPDEDEEITVIKMTISEAVQKVVNGEFFIASDIAHILFLNQLQEEGRL